MSSYIANRTSMYGGKQEEWLAHVRQVSNETATKIDKAVKGEENLEEFFHKILSFLGDDRKQYAEKTGTEKASLFGVRRDQEEGFPGPLGVTALNSPYDEYNERLLVYFQKQLSTLKHTLRDFQETEKTVVGKPFFGKASTLEFKILTGKELQVSIIQPTVSEILRLSRLSGVPSSEMPSQVTSFGFLLKNMNYMQTLKAKSPDDYKKLKMLHACEDLRNNFPKWAKSEFILVTLRAEIEPAEKDKTKKMYALSQYLTWAYRDFKEDPIEHMTGRSVIAILHQDPFLVRDVLHKCAKIFKEIIQWDKKEIEELKNQVAHLQIYLSHAMPFIRGSGAVSEEIEMALYEYHGYKVIYNDAKWINLEALTSLPQEFIENYNSMITLEKL